MKDLHNKNQRSEYYFTRPAFVKIPPLNECVAMVGYYLPKADHICDTTLPLYFSEVLLKRVAAVRREGIK